jgi:hypothetical protein
LEAKNGRVTNVFMFINSLSDIYQPSSKSVEIFVDMFEDYLNASGKFKQYLHITNCFTGLGRRRKDLPFKDDMCKFLNIVNVIKGMTQTNLEKLMEICAAYNNLKLCQNIWTVYSKIHNHPNRCISSQNSFDNYKKVSIGILIDCQQAQYLPFHISHSARTVPTDVMYISYLNVLVRNGKLRDSNTIFSRFKLNYPWKGQKSILQINKEQITISSENVLSSYISILLKYGKNKFAKELINNAYKADIRLDYRLKASMTRVNGVGSLIRRFRWF